MPQLRHLLNYDREHLPVRNQNKHNPIHARIRRNSIRPSKLRLRHAVAFSLIFVFTFLIFRIFFSNSIDSGPDLDPKSKEVKFGHESGSGGNSSDWDSDDRNRDKDYKEEDVLGHADNHDIRSEKKESDLTTDNKLGRSNGESLYNEGGRAELDSYKEGNEAQGEDDDDKEYDDGIDAQDDDDVANHDLVNNHGHDNAEHGKLGRKDVKGEHTVVKSGSGRSSKSKKRPKHRKTSGSTCDMKLLDSTAQLIEPIENKKFTRFSLQYTETEEIPSGISNWEPRFAGHQTSQEREESFYARDQKINCGFVKGPQGLPSTGFDLAEDDLKYMSSCHIAVSSCIFGNSDRLKTPFNKVITRQSKKNICFVMFMDEDTLQTLSSEGQNMDSNGFIGLWKIVVVKNLPFTDMRRVGKVPKFLAHRLFPSARYSIWLDSKLRLQSDPYLVLEYFLWRKGYEYAISNHYDRHCVWDEVAQNKKLNKYNHTIIDQQFEFYQSDGLTRFDPSDPHKLLPSYVPEGSFIVRAHTPMSNLFSCLWFNEVDSFTSRDQLSFAYTYLKLTRMNPGKPFHLNMFKDCERRMITKLFRHRADEKLSNSTQITR